MIAAPIFFVFSPFLLGYLVSASLDATNITYPTFAFYQYALKNNLSILINPFNINGATTYAGTMIGLLSPLNYLFFKFLPINFAFHWLMYLYLVFGAFFVARLAKELGCSPAGSLISAYVFAFSCNYIDLTVFAGLFWLALIFLLIIYIHNHNSWAASIFGGLLVGLGWLTAHSHWMFIALAGSLVFFIYLIVTSKKYNLILNYLVFYLLSTIVGLVQIIPSLVYLSVTVRGDEYFQRLAIFSPLRLGPFSQFIFPLIKGLPGSFFINYIGILPLIFVIYSFLTNHERKIIFWKIYALAIILLVLPFSPLPILLSKIPIVNNFRDPTRWMSLGFVCLSILAGFGFDTWLNNSQSIKKMFYKFYKILVYIVGFIFLLINISYLFFYQKIMGILYWYFDKFIYNSTKKFSLSYYHEVLDKMFINKINDLIYYNPKVYIQLLLLILSLVICKYFLLKNVGKSIFSGVIILAVIINFLLVYPFFLDNFMPAANLYYLPKTVEAIQKDPGTIFPFLQGQSEYEKLNIPYNPNPSNFFIFQSELLVPLANIFYQISSADTHDSFIPNRNAKILGLIGSTRVKLARVTGENLNDLDSVDEKIVTFNKRGNLLDLLSINYVVSNYRLIENDKFSLNEIVTSTPYQIPFFIYKNHDSLPKVFLAKDIIYLDPENFNKNLEEVTDQDNNFQKVTFIECKNCQSNDLDSSANNKFKIIEETNTLLEIDYQGDSPAYLVINNSYLPGWEAKIDNQSVKIYFANFVHQAIYIPAGNHRIVVQYYYPVMIFLEKLRVAF